MAATPEAKIKAKVTKLLQQVTDLYYWMPVPSGYGASTLDYVGCYRGLYFSIETKAPGKHPTARQSLVIGSIHRAGGKVFVIDSDNLSELEDWLYEVGG